MKSFLIILAFGEAAYHAGMFFGAVGGFYGWHP